MKKLNHLMILANCLIVFSTFAQEKKLSLFKQGLYFPEVKPNEFVLGGVNFSAEKGLTYKLFHESSPSYFIDGTYMYQNDGYTYSFYHLSSTHFNSNDCITTYQKSKKNLSNYQKIQVTLGGAEGFYVQSSSLLKYYKEKKENELYIKNYDSINTLMINNLKQVLQEKGANKINICNRTKSNIDNNDSLSNNLLLHFSIDNMIMSFATKKTNNWPHLVKYSLDVYDPQFQLLKKYKIVVFLETTKIRRFSTYKKLLGGEIINYITDATCSGAFEALLNTFLNDNETYLKTFYTHENLINSSAYSRYNEITNYQAQMYNIKRQKQNILLDIIQLGGDISSLNTGSIVDKNSAAYKINTSDPNTAGLTAAALGIADAINLAVQQKELEKKKLAIAFLKGQYFDLENQEKNINEKINEAKFPVFCSQFFPENKELNEAFKQATQKADELLITKRNEFQNTRKIISSELEQNNAKLNQNITNLITPEGMASTNGGNDNSPKNTNKQEGGACAERTTAQWKQTREYQQFINNQGCNKFGYIASRKLTEMMLNNCREFLPPSEIEGYHKFINELTSTINSLPDCPPIR